VKYFKFIIYIITEKKVTKRLKLLLLIKNVKKNAPLYIVNLP